MSDKRQKTEGNAVKKLKGGSMLLVWSLVNSLAFYGFPEIAITIEGNLVKIKRSLTSLTLLNVFIVNSYGDPEQ